MNTKPLISLLVILVLLAACAPVQPPASLTATSAPPTANPPVENGAGARTLLTYAELMNGFAATSPVTEAALALPEGAAQPAHTFEGRLELLAEADSGQFELLAGAEALPPELQHLPEFDFNFVQSGSYLLPAQRGLIVTPGPGWNYFLEPGRVWQEDGDQGLSRASFPFGLVAKNSNGLHNGVMTFLFDKDRVSSVWYQITQETTTSGSVNFWGLLKAVYHPAAVAGAEPMRQTFAQELANRFPARPIEQLATDYPGVDVAAFGRDLTPEHLTLYGLVVNGVNYQGGCHTRFGAYPYCDFMRVPSYSLAKSAFVSVALMRLAQKYGPEVADLLIKDYVPETAGSPGDWSAVTFNNTLDMATGNYRSASYMVDEEGRIFTEFFGAETYAAKIKAAFDWPHSAAPGTRWNYRSSDTFIVTTALQNYLRAQTGPTADLFQFVIDDVYAPLKIGPGAFSLLRTSENNWQGQAIGSFGQWFIHDDLAKLATLLNVNRGALQGEQLLQPSLLAGALQQDPQDRGVAIGPGANYNNAFWSARFTPADGYACEFWVAYMAGYSGNIVALMPNGATYYYFSDNREFTWSAAVREADKIRPQCPP